MKQRLIQTSPDERKCWSNVCVSLHQDKMKITHRCGSVKVAAAGREFKDSDTDSRKVEVGNDVNMSAFFCVVKFFRNKLNKCIKRWNMWKIERRLFVKH